MGITGGGKLAERDRGIKADKIALLHKAVMAKSFDNMRVMH
jgi:hypothetical protein